MIWSPAATVAEMSLANTTSVPPESLVPLSVPASNWVPPLDTVAPLAVPPTSTTCDAPLATVADLSIP